MKIEYELTKEDLTTLVSATNNAFIAVKEIYNALRFGCTVPLPFRKFQKEYDFDELETLIQERLKVLHKFYRYLEGLEKTATE